MVEPRASACSRAKRMRRFWRWSKCLVLAGLMGNVGSGAQAQTLDTSGLAALQSAVHEMCVQPDRKGTYLKVEGDLNAGATLKVMGVGGQGKITKEDWDGISQRLDQYKTDPRACAINLVGILIPILSPPPACAGREITGYKRVFDVTRTSPEMTGGHSQPEWCSNLTAVLQGEQGPGSKFTVVTTGETSRSTCAPLNCPVYTYSCTLHVEADPICK
jgi:hypothetical protein